MEDPKLYFRDNDRELRSVRVGVSKEYPNLMENALQHCGTDTADLSEQLDMNILGPVVCIFDGGKEDNHLKLVD